MIGQMLAFLEDLGLAGLFTVIFLEGSSLPFPGVALVIAYGGLLEHNYAGTALLSLALAATYSIASLLPYFLGNKLEEAFKKKFHKGLKKASDLFKRYGIWSIALSRPFGIGNYISYLAGISRIPIHKYLTLTFLGIYPWCFIMLRLGHYFNGNYQAFQNFFETYQFYFYALAIAVLACIFVYYNKKYQNS